MSIIILLIRLNEKNNGEVVRIENSWKMIAQS